MEISFNRKVFTSMAFFRPPHGESVWREMRNWCFGLICLLLVFSAFDSSLCFIYKFASIDLELLLYALLQIAAYGAQKYCMVICYVQRAQFLDVFQKMQKMYDDCKFNFPQYLPILNFKSTNHFSKYRSERRDSFI